jgi:hypothetical protein
MARGHTADKRARGGERIPPPRSRTRLALGAASVAAAAAVAIYGTFAADRLALLVLALGLAGTVWLACALVTAAARGIVPGLVGVAASWSLSAWTRGAGAPNGTVLAAVGIFIAAEIAYWSLEQASVSDEGELVARRAAGLALRGSGALVLVACVLAALGLRPGGGLVIETVGVLAAVGLLAIVLVLARAVYEAER